MKYKGDPIAGKEAEELRSGVERVLKEMPTTQSCDLAKAMLMNVLDTVDARDSLAYLERNKLMPMSTAPKDATWILAWTNDRYGNRRWQCVHWAQGGGEEQPSFRGWFYFCGDGHCQIDAERLLGWASLPEEPKT